MEMQLGVQEMEGRGFGLEAKGLEGVEGQMKGMTIIAQIPTLPENRMKGPWNKRKIRFRYRRLPYTSMGLRNPVSRIYPTSPKFLPSPLVQSTPLTNLPIAQS